MDSVPSSPTPVDYGNDNDLLGSSTRQVQVHKTQTFGSIEPVDDVRLTSMSHDDSFAFVDVWRNRDELDRVLVRFSLDKFGQSQGSTDLSLDDEVVHNRLRAIAFDALHKKLGPSNLDTEQIVDAGWVNLANFGAPDYEPEEADGAAWVREDGDDVRFK
jgi:hypothetical protein